MTAFVESGGAVVAYEYADVTISAVGPYGRRETQARILFDDSDDPLLALLIVRTREALLRQAASEPPSMGGIS
jgi:hypothetical protein